MTICEKCRYCVLEKEEIMARRHSQSQRRF